MTLALAVREISLGAKFKVSHMTLTLTLICNVIHMLGIDIRYDMIYLHSVRLHKT